MQPRWPLEAPFLFVVISGQTPVDALDPTPKCGIFLAKESYPPIYDPIVLYLAGKNEKDATKKRKDAKRTVIQFILQAFWNSNPSKGRKNGTSC